MIVILDIETQELVPADRNLKEMRISIAGARCAQAASDGTTSALAACPTLLFTEEQLTELFKLLDDAELIVGHNLLGFDYKVLNRYAGCDLCAKYKAKTFDFLWILERKTDRRIALNDLAKRNLGIEKAGAGKDAPQLYREGKLAELKAYLEQDLLITHQLFEHIRQYGKVKYGHIAYKEPVEREVGISITER